MWAFKRKFFVYLFFLIIILFIFYKVYQNYFVKKPTCFDGVQNGVEEGIDCSGNCQYVCLNKVVPINAIWAKNFVVTDGVSNIAGVIENPNFDYEVKSSYKIKNIDQRGVVLNSIEKKITLSPGEKRVIFIPSVNTGNAVIKRTLIAAGKVIQAEEKKPKDDKVSVVSKIIESNNIQSQLIVALKNMSIQPVKNIEVVAILSKKNGEVLDIAKTFVEKINKRETVKVDFTWQKLINQDGIIIDVYPRIED